MKALPNPRELARRLRLLREKAGLSQSGLAEAAGITQASLSRIESAAQQPAALVLAAICRELMVSMDTLLGGDWTEVERQIEADVAPIGILLGTGQPLGLRRDPGQPGGPHSLVTGPDRFRAVSGEVLRRSAAGMRTVILADDPCWQRTPFIAASDGALLTPSRPDPQGAATAIVLTRRWSPQSLDAMLRVWLGDGEVLFVVDGDRIDMGSPVWQLASCLLREGRRSASCVTYLVADEEFAPPVVRGNAAHVLATSDTSAASTRSAGIPVPAVLHDRVSGKVQRLIVH